MSSHREEVLVRFVKRHHHHTLSKITALYIIDDNKGEREHAESAATQKSVIKEEAPIRTGQNGVKRDDREEGEMSGEEGETQEKDDDDDSDDDDVQVTIGDIKAWNVNEQPRNLFKSGATYQKTVAGTTTKPAVTTKGLDIEAQGTINGIPVYEFDLDSIKNEDKPWRKPGADITDYFNYGFTEETWQLYCEKQRRLIALNEGTAPVPKIVTVHTASSTGHTDKDTMPAARRVLAPVTKPAGQINVIGATAKDSRRPESEGDPIPVAGSGFPNRKFVVPPPGLPPTNLPPPHLPPLDYSLPPPGLPPPPGVPPPSMTVPPPGFPPVPDPYETYFAIPPPDRSVPPPGFEDRQPFSYSNTHPSFTNNSYTEASRPQPTHQWDAGSTYSDRSSERDWERERERRESIRRDRSPHRTEEDFNRSDSRKHRDDSDSESRSSKHKSRRRRREKDEEGGETGGSEDAPKTE
ncbi:hypothetical protein C0Q70_05449 [Pomacea canaliculata]|uniref:Pre-mRNA polyadenylation factor Fip1 domain-containing protein n=1 Tax=Pomacea canaliculata TaxID=400727 RepID=A0A2T7PLA6_POMCA|nr:hypothetical protein C0Q70_05449 [Pomacea canaliculata]